MICQENAGILNSLLILGHSYLNTNGKMIITGKYYLYTAQGYQHMNDFYSLSMFIYLFFLLLLFFRNLQIHVSFPKRNVCALNILNFC